jgi:hypothetical protein
MEITIFILAIACIILFMVLLCVISSHCSALATMAQLEEKIDWMRKWPRGEAWPVDDDEAEE